MLPETRLFQRPKSIAPSICEVCSHLRFGFPLLVALTPPGGLSPHGYAALAPLSSVINEGYGSTLGLHWRPQPARRRSSENGTPCMNPSCFRFQEPDTAGKRAHLCPAAN